MAHGIASTAAAKASSASPLLLFLLVGGSPHAAPLPATMRTIAISERMIERTTAAVQPHHQRRLLARSRSRADSSGDDGATVTLKW
jgi:hypothetical protein